LKAVLKLGGFIFDPELSADKIERYARIITAFSRKNRLIVVTGGGVIARRYIAAARALGASETVCDQIGIHVSRLNARLLGTALGNSAFPDIPDRLEDLAASTVSGLVVVMGGLTPGQSTNAVAALAAEVIHADLLVTATDVEGVYTADPRKDSHAKKLDDVTPEELMRILSSEGIRAGEYALMDPIAVRIIQRSRIPATVIDGRDPSNLDKVLSGKRIGTRIVHVKE
jgi:uridylate kinase